MCFVCGLLLVFVVFVVVFVVVLLVVLLVFVIGGIIVVDFMCDVVSFMIVLCIVVVIDWCDCLCGCVGCVCVCWSLCCCLIVDDEFWDEGWCDCDLNDGLCDVLIDVRCCVVVFGCVICFFDVCVNLELWCDDWWNVIVWLRINCIWSFVIVGVCWVCVVMWWCVWNEWLNNFKMNVWLMMNVWCVWWCVDFKICIYDVGMKKYLCDVFLVCVYFVRYVLSDDVCVMMGVRDLNCVWSVGMVMCVGGCVWCVWWVMEDEDWWDVIFILMCSFEKE